MFNFITDAVSGGWNAVSNITGGIGSGMGSLFGNTKVPIQSNIMAPSTAITGIARTVESQASSFSWSSMLGTAKQAIPSSVAPIATAASKSSFWSEVFDPWKTAVSDMSLGTVLKQTSSGLAQGILGSAPNIGGQLSDILLQKLGLKPKTEPVNSQGSTITNYYPTAERQPATTPTAGPQMPGSFNIGFPQTWPISTGQVSAAGATGGLSIALVLVSIAALAVFLARKR